MKRLSRRNLLKGAAAGALAGGAAVLLPSRRVLGANDAINVAIVGFNSRGELHIKEFPKIPGVRVAALCDVDPKILAREVKKFDERNEKVLTCTDARKLLDNKDIDALVIATPNHWHALLTIWACQVGKDVYVEKPVSHDVWEGRKMIEAAAKYDRIVQAGTQNRSDTALLEVVPFIQQGNLGKILWIHGLWYKLREGIGKTEPYIPDFLDYDHWCGPSPLEPLRRNELHYDWHWVWRTGNGDIANLGIHQFDMCRWFLGDPGLPRRVVSFGGRFGVDDSGETPNTQCALFDYAAAPVLLELRNLPMTKGAKDMDALRGTRDNIIVQCENGYFVGGRYGGWTYDNDGKKIRQYPGDGGGGHQANFIEAMRSRKRDGMRARIEQGHTSTAACLMANISYRTGEPSTFEKIKETIGSNKGAVGSNKEVGGSNKEAVGSNKEVGGSNKEAVAMLERIEKHLAANEIDLKKTPITQGAWLTVDEKNETIASAAGPGGQDRTAEAKAQLKGTYRPPYTMPEKV